MVKEFLTRKVLGYSPSFFLSFVKYVSIAPTTIPKTII
tara:strand:- start:521 stop:634 length:114 start_codon:yes stop_codon:yes gene_type:complete